MIYIAGPFFNEEEIRHLKEMITRVKKKYPEEELYIPMEHFVEDGDKMPNNVWANKVFLADVKAIDESDRIVALYMGHYSDTGTTWEIGYAFAKGKPVELCIPDEMKSLNMSLMPLNGCSTCNQKTEELKLT